MEASDDDRISFPSVYLENVPSGVKMPKRGRITFEYELSNVNERVKDEKICFTLDLLQLVDVTAKASSAKPDDGAAALDKFVSKANSGDDESEADDESSDREDYVAE